jgi:hypothetical protein
MMESICGLLLSAWLGFGSILRTSKSQMWPTNFRQLF